MLYLSASVSRTMICTLWTLRGIMASNAMHRPSGLKFFATSACSWQLWLTCEVARLDSEFTTRRSRGGLQRCAGRQSQPREPGELLAAFDKAAVQNEQFDPPGNRHCDANACRPQFQQNELPGALVQYSKFDTRDVGRVRERELGGFDTHWRPVIWVELPKLDEDRTTGLRAGRVAAGRRVANISARGVVAMLVLKDALQHQELLAAAVGVGREAAARGVTDDRGRARHLIADAVEHSPIHPGNGRRR